MTGRFKAPIQIGDWIAEPQTDTISRRGETQKLEPRTMRLLLLLAETPGEVLSVDAMLNEVWHGVVVGPASVYQAISQLRRALGDSEAAPTYLVTVPRKGYRLIAAVTPVTLTPPAQLTPSSEVARRMVLVPDATIEAANQSVATSKRRLNLPGLLIIITVVLLAPVIWIGRHFLTSADDITKSIVVLPFIDMTEEHQDQTFCDGLTEELSNWLAQIPTLRVVARTSAFAFRGQHDVREIGKKLNTTHVLEGSIRRSGKNMRVTAQLIDARTGFHVWTSDYDQQVDDSIKTQELIARAVAESLQIRLTASTTQRFAQRQSANPQAYNLYLLASHYRLERTRESTLQAIELYRQALANDPNFALAYVGLAYAYLNQRWVDTRTVREVAAAAEPLLDTALRLDPQLSELYTVRGGLRSEELRLDEAQSDLQRAVAMNPNNSWALAELGRLYIQEGRPRDALEAYRHTLVLDPLDFLHHARECVALMDLNRYGEAKAACAQARALQDQGNFGTVVTAWLERTQGEIPKALKWNAEALSSAPNDMELYKQRADLLMTIGLSGLARETYQRALAATHDDEEVHLGMAAVVYYDGGSAALRSHLASTGLDDSAHARVLIKTAYFHLLAGDDAAAQQAIARARTTADFNEAALNDAWYARWGDSDLLTVAQSEIRIGDQDAANRHLHEILTLLDREMAAGMDRFGTYALRAEVLALLGDGDGAMQALARAADLGWRREWWAQREPFFAALRGRNDFRALMARVGASNRSMIADAQALLAH
jgi:transcriptional activator of cad operon